MVRCFRSLERMTRPSLRKPISQACKFALNFELLFCIMQRSEDQDASYKTTHCFFPAIFSRQMSLVISLICDVPLNVLQDGPIVSISITSHDTELLRYPQLKLLSSCDMPIAQRLHRAQRLSREFLRGYGRCRLFWKKKQR